MRYPERNKMILGLGTDIVQIDRIQQAGQEDAFLNRIFTPAELQKANSFSPDRKRRFLAMRYAGKEAFVKAVGTGIGPISWQDIEILNNEKGAPVCTLSPKAQAFLTTLFHTDQICIHISLADDVFAVATVILEK